MTVLTSILNGSSGLDVRTTLNAALTDVATLMAATNAVISSGTADPASGVGANGDFYINTTSLTLFGPKASGAWPAGASLKGTNGANGSTIRNGAGAPASTLGTPGDFYVDTTATRLYGPSTGTTGNLTWGAGTSLIGAAGQDASPIATLAGQTANYTLTLADSSTVIRMDSANATTITLPNNMPLGFEVVVIQTAIGQVTFAPASGATMVCRQSFTKTAGQYAIMSVTVILNANGSTAKYLLSGDGAI